MDRPNWGEKIGYVYVGHFCPTDADPYGDIAGKAGQLDEHLAAFFFENRKAAEAFDAEAGPWFVDSVIVEVTQDKETP